MSVVVATHGHCFDGIASAVVFTRLLEQLQGARLQFEYRACGYGPRQIRPDARLLVGDHNAILDYRYYPTTGLSWYFDHHRTSFQEAGDRESFESKSVTGRFFHDPDCSSCARLIHETANHSFGCELDGLSELIHWADTVDTARFDSAQEAVFRDHPVLRMVSVIEHHGDTPFLERFVPLLLRQPLEEVASTRDIVEKFAPIDAKHAHFMRRIRAESSSMGRVVYSDLTRERLDLVGKFAAYALFPDSTYSVLIAELESVIKISVGYNPWCGNPLDTDISKICARYGGGGHPVVGGITFERSQKALAIRIALGIARELAEAPT